jgi:hypothetical protein
MPEEIVQAQGQEEAPSSPGTVETTPESPLDFLTEESSDSFDPLTEIPGADQLPEGQQKQTRDALLRKHQALTDERRQLEQERAAYLEAIQRLQSQRETPEQQPSILDDPNMTPEQRSAVDQVMRIAETVAEQKFQSKLDELGIVDKVDQTNLQLQAALARQEWPEIDRFQGELGTLDNLLVQTLGRQSANKLTVLDKMDFLMGAKLRQARAKKGRRAKAPNVQKPNAPVSTSSLDQASVSELNQFRGKGATAKALEAAMRKHGVSDLSALINQ